jgi:hypothetical protein
MARLPLIVLLSLSSFLCAAFAIDVRGKIQWNDICPGIDTLGSSKVVLDHGQMSGNIIKDGTFVIYDVPEGIYVLSVLAHDYAFDQLRIDVLPDLPTPEIRPYVAGTPLNPPSTISLPYPVSLSARQKHVYFVPLESFNLVGMFQNPMMLLMVLGGGMMLAMPYIMKNMDPEAMESFNNRQARVAGIQSSLQSGDIKSGLSALMSTDDDPKGVASSVPKAVTQGKNRSGKGKRR